MAYTEREILEWMERDRERGAEALVETYAGLLWSVCAKRLKDPEDVKECINDAFSEFCMDYKRYDAEKGSLKNYLCLIADRRAMNRCRDNGRRERAEAASWERQAALEEAWEGELSREELEEAIDALEPLDGQIIRLKYYDGLSYKEIAEKLNLNYEAVKKRGRRSLKKLWKILIIGFIILLLAACAVIVGRYFQFAEGVGFNWLQEDPIYKMTEVSAPCYADGFTFSIKNVVYKNGKLFFSVGFQADKEPAPGEEWVRMNQIYQLYIQSLEADIIGLEEGIGIEEGGEMAYNSDCIDMMWSWKPEEPLPESFTMEINMPVLRKEAEEGVQHTYLPNSYYMEPEPGKDYFEEKPLNLQGPDPKFTVTMSRVETGDDVSQVGAVQLFEDTGFVVCPAERNEEGVRLSVYSLNEGMDGGKYRLSPYLVGRRTSAETRKITLTGKDGSVYQTNWIDCGIWGLDETILDFPPVEPGEYTLSIPYLQLEDSGQISNAVYLPLPKEEGEVMACDETLMFPDGTGLRLTGIEMRYYDVDDEIKDEYPGGYVITYALRPTVLYSVTCELISTEKLKIVGTSFQRGFFYGVLPDREAGEGLDLPWQEQQQIYDATDGGSNFRTEDFWLDKERPKEPWDWLELRLESPTHEYNGNFEIPITIK